MTQNSTSFSLDLERISRQLTGLKIAYPESGDPRIRQTCQRILDLQIDAQCIVWDLETAQLLPKGTCYVRDVFPTLEQDTGDFLSERAQKKGRALAGDQLSTWARHPLYQAGFLLHRGEVNAALGGSVASTAEVIRAALTTVGLSREGMTLSGAFIMERQGETFLYSDCGVIPDPSAEQLAMIAVGAYELWERLRSRGVALPDPKIAFLSFSTKGSAEHASIEKVREGLGRAQALLLKEPVMIDGELQFDAAFDQAIAQRKAPASSVAGRANIFIFPDLNAGNIAYKITQRLAGFRAYGPLLCGVAKPYCDLSRGSTVDDILYASLINLLLGEGGPKPSGQS